MPWPELHIQQTDLTVVLIIFDIDIDIDHSYESRLIYQCAIQGCIMKVLSVLPYAKQNRIIQNNL